MEFYDQGLIMLKLNGYYATPLGYDSHLCRITDDIVHFKATQAQSLPMSLFCDYYNTEPHLLRIGEILFNRWGTAVEVKKIMKNSNLEDGLGAVMFFNLDSDGHADKTEVAVYREAADSDVHSTYISPDQLVFG